MLNGGIVKIINWMDVARVMGLYYGKGRPLVDGDCFEIPEAKLEIKGYGCGRKKLECQIPCGEYNRELEICCGKRPVNVVVINF